MDVNFWLALVGVIFSVICLISLAFLQHWVAQLEVKSSVVVNHFKELTKINKELDRLDYLTTDLPEILKRYNQHNWYLPISWVHKKEGLHHFTKGVSFQFTMTETELRAKEKEFDLQQKLSNAEAKLAECEKKKGRK